MDTFLEGCGERLRITELKSSSVCHIYYHVFISYLLSVKSCYDDFLVNKPVDGIVNIVHVHVTIPLSFIKKMRLTLSTLNYRYTLCISHFR